MASEAPTRELPRVQLAERPVHVRVAGVEPRLLVAARLVSHQERRALDALDHTGDTASLADTLGLPEPATERLLAHLVARGFAARRPRP